MDCTEARRLIDNNIQPGSRSPQSVNLGFHLAECAACRAYREQQNALLTQLLVDVPDSPAPPKSPSAVRPVAPPRAPKPRPTPTRKPKPASPPPPSGPASPRWLRLGGLGLLILVPLVALLWFASVLVRAEQNIAAMVVAPEATASIAAGSAQAEGMLDLSPLVTTEQAATTLVVTPTIMATLPPQATATAVPPSPVPPSPVPPSPVPPPAGNAVNILLLGNDLRPGEQDAPRTDAVMLVRVEPFRDRIALLSLPRDLWVEIPGYGAGRINAANVWGEVYGAPGGGMELARATVSNLLGVPIDHVVMADFQGFIALIDALGGITVQVDKELYDNRFPTMDYGYTEVHFLPGPQQMDGVTALSYSRIRHPDSDFMRIQRQQAVFVGIGERLRERGDLQNVLTLDQTTGALRDYVRTDMPQERIVGLIWAMRGFDVSRVERYALGGDGVSFGVGGDPYALVPYRPVLDELVRQFMGAQ